MVGLSAEFFHTIAKDAPAIDVEVNGLSAACSGRTDIIEDDKSNCNFEYAESLTPIIESLEPSTSIPGETIISIIGNGFSKQKQLNFVSFGGATCHVVSCNTTYVSSILHNNFLAEHVSYMAIGTDRMQM